MTVKNKAIVKKTIKHLDRLKTIANERVKIHDIFINEIKEARSDAVKAHIYADLFLKKIQRDNLTDNQFKKAGDTFKECIKGIGNIENKVIKWLSS